MSFLSKKKIKGDIKFCSWTMVKEIKMKIKAKNLSKIYFLLLKFQALNVLLKDFLKNPK
jgi:hypothetical protein